MKRLFLVTVIAVAVWTGFTGSSSAEQSVIISNNPSGMRLLGQDQTGLTMKLEVGKIDFIPVSTPEGSFVMARIDGFARSFEIGEPDLPVANKLVSIPFGCELESEIVDYEIEEISLADYGLTLPIMPAQPSISKSQDPADVPFEINRDVYATTGYYTQPLTRTEALGTMRNIRLGKLTISPIEYSPTENKIRVYKNLTVHINYRNPDWSETEAIFKKHYSPFFEPIYNQLANFDGFDLNFSRSDTINLVKYPVKYLIISDIMFESQLQSFIEWKTKKGFTVITAYTSEIGSTNTAIKSYINSVYNAGTPEDPAPSFVLFVGDAAQIPPFSGSAGSHITDLKFCELTGDNLPEIYYGRFSAQNPGDLQPQIDKTLEYEKYEMPDPGYLAEVTMVSGVDATYAATHGNGQINYGTTQYFNAAHGISPNVWLYPASAQSGASGAIIQTINDGIGLYNYTAHCSHEGHGNPSFTTTHIPGLTNYHMYLLGIGNCCEANTFASGSTPCFGEAFLQVEDKGGIGYIGGSNSTYWYEDYYWGVGYGPVVATGPTYEQTTLGAYDGVFHDHGEPVAQHYVTNGAIIFAGNLGVTAGGSRVTYYWEIYHLMGDPSVTTYIGVPTTNNIVHSQTVLLTDESFSVQADPGSYVGISVDGVLHGAGYVDSSGTVDVPLAPFSIPGTADIVITAQNREPYIATVQIISPEGPFVIHDEHIIDDFSGNNDGMANCGETVGLDVQLQNVGPDTAYNVTAVLRATDEYVTITDSTESYGEIPGDFGIVNIPGAFTCEFAGDTPDDHVVTFELAVTGSDVVRGDTTWTSGFTVTVHSPTVAYVTVVVDDASGNNNGNLDPGETAELVVVLVNNGSADALSVTAVLSEDDPLMTISDADGTFGDLLSDGGSGDNASDVFVVSADESGPLGYEMTFHLSLTGTGGYSSVVDFDFVVGDRVAFFSDNFSFDQGWTGLGGSGEWTIGPAVGGTGSDSYGGPDPSEDHSFGADNYVMGNDLTGGSGGDYNGSLGTTYWVTSPLFDCSGFTGVELTFWHWLGVESSSYDHVYLQAFNGIGWVTLFENSSTIDESEWTMSYYDLSAHADGNMDFQIRFGIGVTDGSMNYCGWNIDDLELKGYGEIASGSPAIVCQPESLDDSLHLGESTVDTLRVYNTGEVLLRVRFSSSDDWLSFDTDQHNIAAGDSLILPVTVSTDILSPGDYNGLLQYSSNDPLHASGSVAVNLHIYSPDISLPMSSLGETLGGDEQRSVGFVIDNNGPGRLEYEIIRLMFNGKATAVAKESSLPQPLGYRPADPDKGDGSETEPYFAPVTKDYGGPDLWGYNWVDSDDPEGPDFAWVDISSVGTSVTLGDDDSTTALPIGFAFPFYENSYSELYIGSNGIITFGSGSTQRTNKGIPDTLAPNNLVALWWDDLDPRKGGQVLYYADAANERFIVSFDGIPNYYSTTGTGSLTFQAVFHSDGKILLQYGVMNPGDDYDGLTGSSVGIENSAGEDGLEVVYDAEYVHDNLAILFTAASWLSVSPGSGTIEPFESDTVSVGFDATDMVEGDYSGQLTITSNDPDTPLLEVPVTLTVGSSYICGDANGDEAINLTDVTYIINYLYKEGPVPDPEAAADADGSGTLNLVDATHLINYLYKDGPPPVCR